MSFCQGNVEDCHADEDLCSICRDVMACSEHGHTDAGAQNECLHEVYTEEARPLQHPDCPAVDACQCPLRGEQTADSAIYCMQAQQAEGTWNCPCDACPCDCHIVF